MRASQMLNLLAMIELAQKEYYPNDEEWFADEMTVGQLFEMMLEELE
jgi:hypothetical protein|tara:strand:- start:167 stop:307 length:141 start_codon:yes stop_codon:yes gene_type:complete